MLGSRRSSFGDIAPTHCQLLTAVPTASSCVPGLPKLSVHDGFGSIHATKKQKSATPAAV